MAIEFLVSFISVFVVTVLLLRKLIPVLISKKIGQVTLEIGPRWHKSKDGTPTMGGIAFILSILIVMCGVSVYSFIKGTGERLIPLALTLGLAVINGLVGFIDDRCKLLKKKNEGLKAYQKFLLQTAATLIYLFAMNKTGYIDTSLHIPFTSFELELGWAYYIIAFIIITGMVNGVNLTDGVDGLASGVTFVVGAFFALYAFVFKFEALSLAAASTMGATLGFLVYNYNPARVFMGDTGSLFLGGLVTGCAFMINDPLVIVIAGIVYVIEAASVIIQVGVYKLTKKRVFRMAPIHHHYEKGGWGERKIFWIFSLVSLIGCALAWISL